MRQIKSIYADGNIKLFIEQVEKPTPQPHEVLVKVEASPINPSDQGVMFGIADIERATTNGEGDARILTIPVPDFARPAMEARAGKPLPLGNEGAGTVVEAGDSDAARALIGKKVTGFSGTMYGEYSAVPITQLAPIGNDMDSADAASSFVNPMTALAMTEAMKAEGFKGIIHTAAASNLGVMLAKICAADNIPLIAIVRSKEQVETLNGLGIKHALNSKDTNFMPKLVNAIAETEAYLAFDAIGGGEIIGNILTAMNITASQGQDFSIYGSTSPKKVYNYGSLDFGPSILNRGFGLAWTIEGFLLTNFLAKAGMETITQMRTRVLTELGTTFVSEYSHQIGFDEILDADVARIYAAKKTGEKYLFRPNGMVI